MLRSPGRTISGRSGRRSTSFGPGEGRRQEGGGKLVSLTARLGLARPGLGSGSGYGERHLKNDAACGKEGEGEEELEEV